MTPTRKFPRTTRLAQTLTFSALAALILLGSAASAQTAQSNPPPQIGIDDDGTYHLPAQAIPFTPMASKELRDSILYYDRALHIPDIGKAQADGSKPLFKPYRDRQTELYPLDKQDTKIGGIHVFVYTPKGGVAAKNKNRVLIELHGGGCWIDCGALESQPIAYVGKIKVVSIDYRETAYPAGPEDVASVYSDLLKTYKASQIGIYGCSAGGILTARSLAWFQKHDLPAPGAAGILCASAGGPRGDAAYLNTELGEGRLQATGAAAPGRGSLGSMDPSDPMVSPVNSPEMLKKFPPTLMITGTRAMELSTAVYTDMQLTKAGVDSELHVFEGARHGFWYDPAPPESKDVYNIIVAFFDKHLSGSPAMAASHQAQ